MAINDIKISDLPELGAAKATTMVSAIDGGSNYKLSVDTINDYVAAAVDAAKVLGEMSLTSPASQTFTGTGYQKITAFDKIQYEKNIDIDLVNDQIVLSKSQDYKVIANINAEFSNNQGVEFALLIDGLVSESFGSIQGRGTGKPIYLGGGDIDPFTQGTVIALAAREDAGGSVDVVFNKVRIIVESV